MNPGREIHSDRRKTQLCKRLTGTVTDPTGPVVQNAIITLRNYGTNETLTATTLQDGLYRFSLLRPSKYELTVDKCRVAHLDENGLHLMRDNRLFGSQRKSRINASVHEC